MRPSLVLAATADAAGILVFAAVGRASHAETGALADVVRIAWPFLAGGALAWLATRAWRHPLPVWPTGALVWAGTWGVGMLLRGLTGGGLAASFLLVAAIALGVLLLGWRGILALVRAVRRAAVRGAAARGATTPRATS
ncbi:MAG: DUF3054 domain-containing protein [Cellulomonas sp.]